MSLTIFIYLLQRNPH